VDDASAFSRETNVRSEAMLADVVPIPPVSRGVDPGEGIHHSFRGGLGSQVAYQGMPLKLRNRMGSPGNKDSPTSWAQVGSPELWAWHPRRTLMHGLEVRDKDEEWSMPDEGTHGERMKAVVEWEAPYPLVGCEQHVDEGGEAGILR
jgi:hypothetical protein